MLHDLLSNAARLWPETIAVDCGNESISYAALDSRSDRLAATLLRGGARRGDRVAILCHKSIEAYVAIYGVLKAGCAYVPLDRRVPAERLGYILDDCAVKALVVGTASLKVAERALAGRRSVALTISFGVDGERIGPVPLVDASEGDSSPTLPRDDVTDTDLAYILYTSGSTGMPKGVMISHLNSMSFVRWASDHASLRRGERVSGQAPLHFDLSVFDVFATARAGATLLPVPDGMSTFPFRLSEWIRASGINVWYSVPTALSLIAQQRNFDDIEFPDLRLLIFAGEVFPVRFLNMWLGKAPHVTFMNWYGPTETNVVTSFTLTPGQRVSRPVPIGKPCRNVEVFLVDEAGNRLEGIGREGELCARGSTVALGYWGDPQKTERAFAVNPLLHERVYRTGDVVRRNEQREYEFIGRRDHMVKSRGYRIELGELESALFRVSGVGEAAVVPLPDETLGNVLVACVSADTAGDEGAWIDNAMAALSRQLPAYMLPLRVALFDELPKTSTGKVDRRLLLQQVSGSEEEASDD